MAKPKQKKRQSGKGKSPSVSKTDGKESTSAQVADVVVEQPLVIATGGKTVIETTGAVASGEIVSSKEKQTALNEMSGTEEASDKRGKEAVTLTAFMSNQKRQDDSSSEGKRDDSEVNTQDSEEVPPEHVDDSTALKVPGKGGTIFFR